MDLYDTTESPAQHSARLKRKAKLRARLGNLVNSSESDDSSDYGQGPIFYGPSQQIRSTSELKLAPLSLIRKVKPTHPALYVLSSRVGHPESEQQGRTANDGTDDGVEISQELPLGRQELPGLISIRSLKLLAYLDHNIYDGSLPWSEKSPGMAYYTIPRPFKMLVSLNDEIRKHLSNLEEYRRSIKSITEDEYDADWRSNPPDDSRAPGHYRIEVSEQTLPGLTGLIKDFHALITFMNHFIAPSISRKLDDHVYFSDLWYTFPTSSLIYIKDKNIPQKIWKVIQRTGGWPFKLSTENAKIISPEGSKTSQFVIDCYCIDYDGNRYIPVFHRIFIDPFDGLEPVTGLPTIPLQAAEDAGYIDKEALVRRGRDFIKCTQPTHRNYTGRTQIQRPNGEMMVQNDTVLPENASRYSEWIDSEVMVDIDRALHAVPAWRPSTSEYRAFEGDMTLKESNFDDDSVWDRKSTDVLMRTEAEKWQRWDRNHPPSEPEDLLLLPGHVFAFVFRTRKWACLQLGKGHEGKDMLRKRDPRPEPWNQLELPDGHKNLVQSLIESHIDGNASSKVHFDLVRAKGKGVIILLHGVPGVGKTSTAECAAEANNRPLLPITCGDLGTTPRDVEAKLQEAFQLAQLWNCVLLLDEADVFLAQRSHDDIQRNALVSVFLRVLEYYEGILFLTSNRVGVFDEALKSRLHMALYYPPLQWKYTQRIWKTHLNKLNESGLFDLEYDDILDYAETFFSEQSQPNSTIGPVWNGRQIRNAFQSAVALAGYKHKGTHKIVLNRDHFEKVSKVSNQFNNYLWSIQCKTDADKAANWGLRYDGWVKAGSNTGNTAEPQINKLARSGSIDGGSMTFALNSTAQGPLYQQQMVPPGILPMQGLPQHQQQSQHQQALMGIQNGTNWQGQGQFSQQQQQYTYQQQQQQQQQQLNPYQQQPVSLQPQPQLQQQQTSVQGQIQHDTAPQKGHGGQPQVNMQFQPHHYGSNLN
ncbi:hypothetical protein GGR58DRAFT_468241 [Xylaria digitata]|nr:hypothetical protein GGR58DRAFT_468241 [Xylaria digitata]